MHFRKIATWLTLSATAATPLAIAQNPTILQGNYISNVFGNSNFVLNPNAQTNVANVTNATRSPTTPLVATSEFNLSLAIGANATWTLRAFDQGMKGQNCEARFSYRGFATATTKAELVQNSLVVASLTLTPTTDPRIASINFPCGDLAHLTTFRIAQTTAAMTGTNEIGGVYVGLATNMANVAQAEMVGGGEWTAVSWFTRPANVTQATYTPFTTGIGNYTTGAVIGKATSAGSDTTVTFPYLPAGEYQVVTNLSLVLLNQAQTGECKYSIQEIDSNTYNGQTFSGNIWTSGTIYTPSSMLTGRFNFTAGGQRRFRIVSLNQASGAVSACSAITDTTSNKAGIYVYRFPSSSELVVKPETQNVFGGVVWSGNIDISTIGVTTNTIINTTSFGTPTPFGKAAIASTSCGLTANDIGVCMENVPPGTYEVTTSLEQGAVFSFGTAGATACSARIHVSGTSFSDTSVASAFTEVGTAGQTDWVTLSSGIVTISSFQPKLSLVLKQSKNTGNGRCLIRSSANGTTYPARPTITFKPLDQPSNSALYVEGPVKAAATGAAIASGYVGRVITNDYSSSSFNMTNGWQNAGSFTLPVGVWNCSGGGNITRNTATLTNPNAVFTFSDLIGAPSSAAFYDANAGRSMFTGTNPYNALAIGLRPTIIRSTGSQLIFPYATVSGSTVYLSFYLDAISAGTPLGRFEYTCVQIN